MRIRILGFTLLEVLAALVIVALGMLGVIEAVSQTASNSSYIRDKTLAHWVAMNQLTQARLSQSPPKIDKSSDEVEMADRRWRWTMEVTQTPVESVRRIDISVRLKDADENSSLATVTGFYGAALAQPGSTIVMWQSSEDEQNGGEDGGKDDDKKDDGKDTEQPPEQPAPPEPGDGGEPPPQPEPSE
jgi:general secretion pathway protein I